MNFGTIQNNTALKPRALHLFQCRYFGTIQNNTALKHSSGARKIRSHFGTIQNNTALKQHQNQFHQQSYFGTIQNNTALKHVLNLPFQYLQFWNHSEQHSSKTKNRWVKIEGKILEPFRTTQL